MIKYSRKSKVMKDYRETRGILVKKYRNWCGQYIFVVSEDGRKTKICVGKSFFESAKIGTAWTLGHIKRKLINVRPGICASTDGLPKTDIRDIWNLTDQNQFLIAMNERLDRKCGGGMHPAALTPEERYVYVADTFQSEVNNGGFSQYLYNSSGALAGELRAALNAIGADRTAEIYENVLAALPPELPQDEMRRTAVLDEAITADINAMISAADDAFYASQENLDTLLYRYICNHKNSFL